MSGAGSIFLGNGTFESTIVNQAGACDPISDPPAYVATGGTCSLHFP